MGKPKGETVQDSWRSDSVPDEATALLVKAAQAAEPDLRALPAWHATARIMGLLDLLALNRESDRARAQTVDPSDGADERIAYVIQTLKDEFAARAAADDAQPASVDDWRALAEKLVTALDAIDSSNRSVVRLVAAERDAALRQSELRWRGVWQLRLDLAKRATVCRFVDELVERSRNEHGVPSPAAVTSRDVTRLFAVAASSTHDVDRSFRLRLDVVRTAWRWRFASIDAAGAAAEQLTAAVDALATLDPGGFLSLTVEDLYRSFDDSHAETG